MEFPGEDDFLPFIDTVLKITHSGEVQHGLNLGKLGLMQCVVDLSSTFIFRSG